MGQGRRKGRAGGSDMTTDDFVGRRVKILAWDDLRGVLPMHPRGTVTHIADFGDGSKEVTVRVDGLAHSYFFGPDEVEVMGIGPPSRGFPGPRRARAASARQGDERLPMKCIKEPSHPSSRPGSTGGTGAGGPGIARCPVTRSMLTR